MNWIRLLLRKIVDSDLDNIFEVCSNEKLFQYSPVMLKRSKNTVANMVGHFHKRKCIFFGICLNSEPNNIVGIAEMFDN